MKRCVQKVGTNPKFLDKSVSVSFGEPWDFMALRKARMPSGHAERRSREAILSQNGESCDWWTYGESNPGLDYAIVACYHYTIGP